MVAETKSGDVEPHGPRGGAHLDSVPAGPGVNDDGSGTAFQLELAEQLAKCGHTAAEQDPLPGGLAARRTAWSGSQYYAAHMSASDVAKERT